MAQRGLIQRITSRQAVFAMAMVVALVIVSAISSIVAAAALNERSITPSSVSTRADNVQYRAQFSPESTAGAMVIEFCENSPLVGQNCTAPVGLDVASAATTDASIVAGSMAANKITITSAMAADSSQDITFSGITNPDDVGAIYARMLTYANEAGAAGYVSNDPSAVAEVVDFGSVAMYFTDSVSVSGTVLETLTFCVSGEAIADNCVGANSPTTLLLDNGVDEAGILSATEISEGQLYVQMNTNAAGGAVVRLKSSVMCGGLQRQGSDKCEIAAAMRGDITAGQALFGLMLADATPGTGAVGTLIPHPPIGEAEEPYYSTDEFAFHYDESNDQGVTSTFGDPFLSTAGAMATNQNMVLTFGASIANNTPAGTYATDISMIAVGKF